MLYSIYTCCIRAKTCTYPKVIKVCTTSTLAAFRRTRRDLNSIPIDAIVDDDASHHHKEKNNGAGLNKSHKLKNNSKEYNNAKISSVSSSIINDSEILGGVGKGRNSKIKNKKTYDIEKENVGSLVDDLLTRCRTLIDYGHNYDNHTSKHAAAAAHHVVAFSGGIDSSVTAAILQKVVSSSSLRKWNTNKKRGRNRCDCDVYGNEKITAVLGLSPAVSTEQRILAEEVANQIGLQFEQIQTNENNNEVYVANTGKSCYICKTYLYTTIQYIFNRYNINRQLACLHQPSRNYNAHLYNGTIANDTHDETRLGLIAAKKFYVRSPLMHLPKTAVRLIGKHLGLVNWNHAASPCLRSRLALGVEATYDHLQKVELAERFVRSSLSETTQSCNDDEEEDQGNKFNKLDIDVNALNLRVRILSQNRAMIEVDDDALVDEIKYRVFHRYNHSITSSSSVNQTHDSSPPWTEYFQQGLKFSSVDVRRFKTGSVAHRK